MLIRPIDHFKKFDIFKVPYKGIVVSNTDPKQLGRIKVNIPSLLEGDETDLPFVFPDNPTGLGGRADSGNFTVPEVGSEVKIEFPFDDIYSPFYTGYWQSEATHQGDYNEDYPESYGFRDSQGTSFKIDKAKKLLEFLHTSGFKFTVDNSGAEFKNRNILKLIAEDNATELLFDFVTGDIKFTAKNNIELNGLLAKINTIAVEIDTGNYTSVINGSKKEDILNNRNQAVGGNRAQSVVGDSSSTVGGNSSEVVANSTERIYGNGLEETIVVGGRILQLLTGSDELTILLGNKTTTLTAGNYSVDVVAGNIKLSTLTGTAELSNALASVKIDIAGNVDIDSAINTTIKALSTASVQGTAIAELKGALTLLGSGAAPVITTLTDPVEDFVTGKPKIGVQTVLAGV